MSTTENPLVAAPADDVGAFTQAVKALDDDQLAAAIAAPEDRQVVLDRLFGLMETLFDAAKGANVEAVIHWNIADGDLLNTYQVVVEGGTCRIGADLDREPRVGMRVGAVPFLRLMAGQTTGLKLLARNKLKVTGDVMFAPQTSGLFRNPNH